MPNEWQSVTALPPLETEEIQVWRIDLENLAGKTDLYRQHLSPVELERADRLRAGQLRTQFIVARACLRILLGNILDLKPRLVPITLSAYGKPEIPAVDGLPLFFNVAHSRGTVLIALCRSSRVGVDLEYLDRKTDVREIARNSFTDGEFRQIEAAAGETLRQRAFFQCWTRKEAVAKADGRGLSLPLTSFEVPVLSAARSSLVHVVEESGEPGACDGTGTWFVSDLAMGVEVAAAFAVEAGQNRIETRTFHCPELLRLT